MTQSDKDLLREAKGVLAYCAERPDAGAVVPDKKEWLDVPQWLFKPKFSGTCPTCKSSYFVDCPKCEENGTLWPPNMKDLEERN